jgi:hypothetical protein
MMFLLKTLVLTVACTAFVMAGVFSSVSAAKDKRSQMSEAQKKQLRAQARAYCMKNYVKGLKELDRVEIQSTGKVICWIRQ